MGSLLCCFGTDDKAFKIIFYNSNNDDISETSEEELPLVNNVYSYYRYTND